MLTLSPHQLLTTSWRPSGVTARNFGTGPTGITWSTVSDATLTRYTVLSATPSPVVHASKPGRPAPGPYIE